jgi:hypothetical protein
MTPKVDARFEDETVDCRRWWRRLRLAVVLSALGFLIIFDTGTFAQIKSEPTPGGPSNPAPPNPEPSKTPGPGGSGPQTNLSSRLTKLAPESVLVQMNNGVGQATVVYSRKAGEAAPILDWTEAIGSANSIAKDKITVQWVDQPQKVGQYEIATLRINVETSDWVEPNVIYKSKVIFIWPDAQAPQTENFTITNAVVADFTISRAKIDAVLMSGQPTTADFIVSNSGKEKITKLTFSSTDLEDSTTHRRVDFGTSPPLTLQLEPGREQQVALPLPRPSYAGTYIGTLNVTANDRVRKSVPLSVITRGPTLGALSRLPLLSLLPLPNWFPLPFILFVGTLGLGYWLSTYLEQWFGLGGLQRAQALVALEKANSNLAKTLAELRAWETAHAGIELDAARLQLNDGLRELKGLIEKPDKPSTDDLTSSAARFTTLAAAGQLLGYKVQTATAQWNTPTNLKPVIEALDAVPFPAAAEGLENYRKALAKVLMDHASTRIVLPAGAPMPSSDILSERVTAEQLELKIERMNLLQHATVAIVVFITGYTTLYWKDADFGTLLDYLTVFLWALGLSATGASILTRAKPTSARAA